ncbi:hypothetical protein EX30DRAFT_396859 [Ascodesmis nigricans]|uniref:F-box domain-containing protein n=1 Tax=Ascodesmis nigricans TaxID=341454 RepID=A0A4S2MTJ1_9PEZI|nr:hypothetical protein EX30DRAFT_396859 [Ascodesmis nigricans]
MANPTIPDKDRCLICNSEIELPPRIIEQINRYLNDPGAFAVFAARQRVPAEEEWEEWEMDEVSGYWKDRFVCISQESRGRWVRNRREPSWIERKEKKPEGKYFIARGRYHWTGRSVLSIQAKEHPGRYSTEGYWPENEVGAKVMHEACWCLCRNALGHVEPDELGPGQRATETEIACFLLEDKSPKRVRFYPLPGVGRGNPYKGHDPFPSTNSTGFLAHLRYSFYLPLTHHPQIRKSSIIWGPAIWPTPLSPLERLPAELLLTILDHLPSLSHLYFRLSSRRVASLFSTSSTYWRSRLLVDFPIWTRREEAQLREMRKVDFKGGYGILCTATEPEFQYEDITFRVRVFTAFSLEAKRLCRELRESREKVQAVEEWVVRAAQMNVDSRGVEMQVLGEYKMNERLYFLNGRSGREAWGRINKITVYARENAEVRGKAEDMIGMTVNWDRGGEMTRGWTHSTLSWTEDIQGKEIIGVITSIKNNCFSEVTAIQLIFSDGSYSKILGPDRCGHKLVMMPPKGITIIGFAMKFKNDKHHHSILTSFGIIEADIFQRKQPAFRSYHTRGGNPLLRTFWIAPSPPPCDIVVGELYGIQWSRQLPLSGYVLLDPEKNPVSKVEIRTRRKRPHAPRGIDALKVITRSGMVSSLTMTWFVEEEDITESVVFELDHEAGEVLQEMLVLLHSRGLEGEREEFILDLVFITNHGRESPHLQSLNSIQTFASKHNLTVLQIPLESQLAGFYTSNCQGVGVLFKHAPPTPSTPIPYHTSFHSVCGGFWLNSSPPRHIIESGDYLPKLSSLPPGIIHDAKTCHRCEASCKENLFADYIVFPDPSNIVNLHWFKPGTLTNVVPSVLGQFIVSSEDGKFVIVPAPRFHDSAPCTFVPSKTTIIGFDRPGELVALRFHCLQDDHTIGRTRKLYQCQELLIVTGVSARLRFKDGELSEWVTTGTKPRTLKLSIAPPWNIDFDIVSPCGYAIGGLKWLIREGRIVGLGGLWVESVYVKTSPQDTA